MRYAIAIGGREVFVSVDPRQDGRVVVAFDGKTFVADLRTIGGGPMHALIVGASSCEVAATRERDGWRIELRGGTHDIRAETEIERAARAIDSTSTRKRSDEVRARMPGFVTRVLVSEGDVVTEGSPLMIIEAMKMENEIRAECPGVVAGIAVSERQTVNNGDVLLRIV